MKKFEKDGVKFTSFASVMEEGLQDQAFEIAGKLKNAHVALMPDAHIGFPAPIGLTVMFNEVAPENRYDIVELVGNDIGCGVLGTIIAFSHELTEFELEKFYEYIEQTIPILTNKYGDTQGTLGGGNHFIELGKINDSNNYLLTVHTGSRAEGANVYKRFGKKRNTPRESPLRTELIEVLKKVGLEKEIEGLVDKADFSADTLMSDDAFSQYLYEAKKAVSWACANRHEITDLLINFLESVLGGEYCSQIENVHNYFEDNILRKGAIKNAENKLLLTPLSMKEGVLVSLGMMTWEGNQSAMHGAGRILSRKLARQALSVEKFKDDMEGIVSRPSEELLDEAPDAYKTKEMILKDLYPICVPMFVARPVLNFKGTERTTLLNNKNKA